MTPSELYQAGKLTEAVEAALADVKKHPTDTGRRAFLCDLLCFTGQWERADKQLDAIGRQDPQAIVTLSLLRQLIRAEIARQQFFEEGRVPEVVEEPTKAMKKLFEASLCLREDKQAEAADLMAQAEAERTKPSGVCDGQPFDDWRDLDDLTAPVFEVLTSTGKYFWIPIELVEVIEFRPPERAHDLLWRRAHMAVAGGPDGEVYLPSLYPLTFKDADDQLRLGRGTDWRGEEGQPIRGIGQRMYLIGDDTKSILELQNIEFHRDK